MSWSSIVEAELFRMNVTRHPATNLPSDCKKVWHMICRRIQRGMVGLNFVKKTKEEIRCVLPRCRNGEF